MKRELAPAVFYRFARGVIDFTPDYNAEYAALALMALDNLPAGNRMAERRTLRICLADLLRNTGDRDALALWQSTGARVQFRKGRGVREFLKNALVVLDAYIANGGGPSNAHDPRSLDPNDFPKLELTDREKRGR
jgi:hypothetical protein